MLNGAFRCSSGPSQRDIMSQRPLTYNREKNLSRDALNFASLSNLEFPLDSIFLFSQCYSRNIPAFGLPVSQVSCLRLSSHPLAF